MPDLVVVPIGGNFVMNPRDAAVAWRELVRPRYAIPVHYGTAPQLKGTPQEYSDALGKSAVQAIAMQPGEQVTF